MVSMIDRKVSASGERWPAFAQSERRRSPRARISCELLLRSADQGFRQFEELVTTLNISRHGFYFRTPSSSFHKGRKLIVIIRDEPLSNSNETEFPAEVVRVDWRADGYYCIAAQFMYLTSLME